MVTAMDSVTPPPYTTRQLRRYRCYPTLYAERQYPSAPHTGQVATPFRFLNLPPELRMLTYTAALTVPFPIELWPETDDDIASHQLRRVERNMQYLRVKMRQRGVNLSLPRVCKQIRYEATRCFYGENEWRFSGTNGWMVAHAFLFATNVFGWQHIRSITLPLPFQFTPQGHMNHGWGKVKPATSSRAMVRLANRIPFATPQGWTYTSSVVDVCCVLGKCENPRVVNLVLPAWYEPGSIDESGMQKFVQRIEKLRNTKSRGLKVRLVRVSKADIILEGNLTVVESRQWTFMHTCRQKGWEVKQARCDKVGRFHIEAA